MRHTTLLNLQTPLGDDARQRLRLRRSLAAAGVYAVCLLLQWGGVEFCRSDPAWAAALCVFISIGVVTFIVMLHSGYSKRFEDAAMTLPQMVFAIIALAMAYLINPPVRGVLFMVIALVMVFGAFTLPARACRGLGWFAVAVFGATMALGAWYDPLKFDPHIEAFHFVFIAAVLPTLSILAGQLSQLRVDQQRQKRELRDAMARLTLLATRDELTGLPNRRHVQEWIGHEFARSRRSGAPLCIAIIDLDHFKRINDEFGHACGDAVLRIFARAAGTVLRDVDVLARWGGEEFLLAMPDTTLAASTAVLERLREHLTRPSTWAECPNVKVEFSAGLTTHRAPQTLEQAVQRADTALYAAKAQGRGRVVVG